MLKLTQMPAKQIKFTKTIRKTILFASRAKCIVYRSHEKHTSWLKHIHIKSHKFPRISIHANVLVPVCRPVRNTESEERNDWCKQFCILYHYIFLLLQMTCQLPSNRRARLPEQNQMCQCEIIAAHLRAGFNWNSFRTWHSYHTSSNRMPSNAIECHR